MGWLFIGLFAFCGAVFADCHGLLHTLLGPTGVSTYTIDSKGHWTTWRDQFSVKGMNWEPDFHTESRTIRPSDLGTLRSFSALTPMGTGARLGLVSDNAGGLLLVLHNHRAIPIHAPQLDTPSASALVSPSLYRHYQMATSTPAGRLALQSGNIQERKILRQLIRENYQLEGSVAYLASENSLYRVPVQSIPLDPKDDAKIREALREGPVEVMRAGGLEEKTSLRATPIIDLAPVKNRESLLIPSGDPEHAFKIQPMEKVMEFTDRLVMQGIDRLKIIGKHTAVVSSEIGQVAVVDLKTGETLHALTLDRPGWLGDVSGHRIGDSTVVWAINVHDGKIYRWSSDDLTRHLTPFSEQLPEGVTPVALSSMGLGIPEGYFSQSEQLGYFSNFRFRGRVAEIERTLVLGSDGKIYGWAMEDLTLPDFHWVTHPFSDERE